MMLTLTACQTNAPSEAETTSSHWLKTPFKKEKPAPQDIWGVIAKEFELQKYWDNPRVQAQVAFYSRNKSFFDMVSTNAEPYLYQVFDEVKKAGLPAEMIVLPMVESGFDPYVYSPGKAAGIWQFIPGTGRLYGLKQVKNYDGRRDIHASTQAAVKYLQKLNQELNGDWLLTLAAYNSGEGAIKRAVEANRRAGKKTDYFSLNLRKETAQFVPRILAISKMLSNPKHYGIELNYIPYSPYYVEVKLPHNSGFKELAASTNVDVDVLKVLNPGYSKSANTIDKQYAFLVPVESEKQFSSNSIPTVKTADKADKITPPKSTRTEKTHTVKSGDTLKTIALAHHVSSKALAKVNNIDVTATLQVGRQLKIPSSTAVTTQNNVKVSYRIKKGDTLGGIAKQFSVSVSDIKKWNPITAKKQKLALGDVLTIYPKEH